MRIPPRPGLLFESPVPALAHDFLITVGGPLSLHHCVQDATRAARILRRHGVRPGHRVGILAANSPEAVILMLALWRAGAVAVPLNLRWPQPQIEEHLAAVGGSMLVADTPYAHPPARIRVLRLGTLVTMRHAWLSPNPAPPSRPLIPGPWSSDATIIFTSGSTGRHKAVLHTFGNHYANALGAHSRIPFSHGDVWLLTLPLCHVGGLAPIFRALLGGGAIASAPAGTSLGTCIENFAATHVSLVPAQLHRICENPAAIRRLAAMKLVLVGGSATPPSLLARARAHGIPAVTTYGSTEMASQIATADTSAPERLRLLPCRRLAIAPDGEILVRGPTLCRGYVEGARVRPARESDGWSHTGDIGALDPEGCLSVGGRKDTMFISGGENMHPEEIEQALMHAPGVTRVVVVPIADAEFGQRPVAFVAAQDFNEPAFRDFLAPRIGRFKLPVRFLRWPEEASPGEEKADRAEFARRAAAILRKDECELEP